MVKDIYFLYFLLALLYQMHITGQSSETILSVWSDRWQLFMTIISQSHAWGRLPFARGQREVEMTDGNRTKFNVSGYIIMSTIIVLMLETYQRQFIWIYIFSMVQIYVKYLMPLCVQGVLILCLWIVPAFLFRVQGHVHMTLQSMCKVWIDEMWNMVGIEILLFFLFFFFFCSKESSVTVRSGKRQAKHRRQSVLTHGLLWLRRL